MYSVELYSRVRRAVMVEGKSSREVARLFGIHRETVKKMCQYSIPPGYRRSKEPVSPKLASFVGVIDEILKADQSVHKKQRHTAIRIFERLKTEHGFTGGYTIVREYVHRVATQRKEMFIPLSHEPGHAQVDFGEADGYVGGKKIRYHYFCLDLPHSDTAFVKAYPAEITEAFLDGHVSAFEFIGGVPKSILYDNTKIAVSKILGGQKRKRTRAFSELQSHYLFEDKFGRPAKGNDKGKVEGLVGYSRRHFMVPLIVASDFDELNAKLKEGCLKRQQAILRSQTESIAQRLKRDQAVFLPLPAAPYEACHKELTRVSSLSLVRYRTNDYSVPTRYGHREVLVKATVDHVRICLGSEVIACHKRSYEREGFVYDPLHYLELLEKKPRALDQAAPLQHWKLPEAFERLRRLLEIRMERRGRKEYIQVLRLIEIFSLSQVEQAILQALGLGAISFDAIKHLALCALERRPPKLDGTLYPYLPKAHVEHTRTEAYLTLLHSQREVAHEHP